MAAITTWNGYQSVVFEGEEIGAARGFDVYYRFFRNAAGGITVCYTEHDGFECVTRLYEFSNLDEVAATNGVFLLALRLAKLA